jgi:hypothetical protein
MSKFENMDVLGEIKLTIGKPKKEGGVGMQVDTDFPPKLTVAAFARALGQTIANASKSPQECLEYIDIMASEFGEQLGLAKELVPNMSESFGVMQ